jgi:serine/threonine protein kinase
MEDVCENIDKKYDIIEKKGSGATSIVYLVKDSTTKKIYAAKILKKQNICFNYEIEMLNALKNAEKEENQYILNLVNNGTGDVVKKDKVLKDKQYLILEYASKGSLINYMKQFEQGLKKRICKSNFC